MKDCIVLSGQYRSFDTTWKTIKEFIELNDLDVYCHLWSTDETEIQNVKDRLNPVKFLHEDYKVYMDVFDGIDERIRMTHPKGPNQDKLAGNASMNFGRKQAFDLVDKEYRNLVYCRYDISFNPIFKFDYIDVMLTPLEESYNLISDIFAIMPFEVAKHYFIYDEYERLHSTQFEPEFESYLRDVRLYGDENIRIHKYERYCPHMMLLRNIYMNGVKNVGTNQLTVSLHR